MKHLAKFPLEDGDFIWVEVEDLKPKYPEEEVAYRDRDGVFVANRPQKAIENVTQTLDKALDKIKPAATSIITKIRSIPDAPDEIKVQFGLKLSMDVGAIIASGGVEANYNVTLTWKTKKADEK